MAGQDTLSEVEGDIVLAFTPRISSNEARWSTFLSKADRVCLQVCPLHRHQHTDISLADEAGLG